MHKFGPSLLLAITLHFVIVMLFSFSFESKPELVKAEAMPEIIEATVLDSDQIQAEMDKLEAAKKPEVKPEPKPVAEDLSLIHI